MTKQLITVGHSPDPDDAFMFYALAHDKIDTGDLQFRHELQDIETLNRRALRGELEVTAISIHAYAHLAGQVCPAAERLQHGRSLWADGRRRRPMNVDELTTVTIAVPGTHDHGVPDAAAAAARAVPLRGACRSTRSSPRWRRAGSTRA